MELSNYHLDELHIARTPGHPHRIMPPISKADRIVLDVGCGAGQTLIATTFAPGTQVVGLDRDKSALSLGRQLDDTISFVCARAERLPFQSESFDFVFSRVALPYTQLNHALSEIWRVLKPDGRIWLVLHPYPTVVKETVSALSRLQLKRAVVCIYVIANGVALNVFGKEFHLPFKKDYYESFQTISGIKSLLRKAGFQAINAERNHFFVCTAKKINSNIDLAV